jgi:DHA1 family inner membrane transport protein
LATGGDGVGRARIAVAALAVAAFCFGVSETLPIGLLPLIADDLNVPVSAAGLLVTGHGLVVAIVSVPLTALSTAVPRRLLLTAVMGGFVATTLAAAAAPDYGVLLCTRVVTALAQAVFWPVAAVTAAALMPPERRGSAASFVFAGGSIAIVAGVPAGTWLAQQAGWRTAFAAMAVVGLVALAAIAAFLPGGSAGRGQVITATAPDRRRFVLMVVTVTLAISGGFTFYTYITEFLTRVSGFPEKALSPLLLGNGTADLVGLVIAGILVHRGGRHLLAAAALGMTGVLAGLWLLGDRPPAAAVGVVLLGLGIPAIATGMQARVLETAPGNVDIAAAWGSAAFNVAIAGGALTGALLLPVTGIRSLALAGALFTAAALVLTLTFAESTR